MGADILEIITVAALRGLLLVAIVILLMTNY